ncbi:hypothetical protein HUT16_19225 [Kitasatospora sp. NA04385]|uniref:hypothetical protein n=1 Tax=Kitasatospora sp. NA04385 TaxID=2742135 RepID=UPI001592084B|nr:hypothetical protein [Kitasatospora sp. NA04385]QKW20906.1 hypothetical protein HUT16_19225 [Kitasatospora sp. NA04385]
MRSVTAWRTTVLPPYTAQLRVYEPLAAFPEPDRARWQAYAAEHGPDAEGPGQSVAAAALAEQRAALAAVAALTPRPLPEQEDERAYVRLLDGVVYVCPWTTRLRGWLALQELRRTLPAHLVDTVLPPALRAAGEADRERWQQGHPDARPWIASSRWEVPLRWFLPFGEEDRRHVPAGEYGSSGEGERPEPATLFYLTPMVQARRRVARAYRVLRERAPGGPLADGAEEVGRWLEEFHPRSLVELDYGGLAGLLGPRGLAEEHSVGELADGLGSLRAGDTDAALRAHEALTARWRRVLALRQAS